MTLSGLYRSQRKENNMAVENITIENARIIFRNLSGKPDKFNPRGGKRTFSVVIDDPKFADQLRKEGWNVKDFKPRDGEEGEPGSFLQVKVLYSERSNPHIYLCTKKNKTMLNEETIGSIDYAEISSVDLVIRPYEYDVQGKSGVAAYVKTMYVNVVEDEFADKYSYDDDEEFVPFN